MVDKSDLEGRVRELVEANQLDAGGARYTRPAPGYPHQGLWDSCLHAVVHDALGNRERARAELVSLFRAQEREGPDRGRLPHMTFIDHREAAGLEPSVAEACARDAMLWRNPRASTITEPPIVAETALRIGD